MMLLILLMAVFALTSIRAEISVEERRVIDSCLQRYGGLSFDNAKRLERYAEWADNYEEFPCFTNCYLSKFGNIYKHETGFNEEEVIRQFGEAVHKACLRRLFEGRDHCDIAYNGFHCLVTLVDDPFVLIESLSNITTTAKTVMKDSLRQFPQELWDRIKDYSRFPTQEPIPCYTKHFVDALNLLHPNNREWNISNMQKHLNIPAETANTSHCHSLIKKRKRNACAWVYKEVTCYVKA